MVFVMALMASVTAQTDLAGQIALCTLRDVQRIVWRTKGMERVSKEHVYVKTVSVVARVKSMPALEIAVVMECVKWAVKVPADAHRDGMGKTALAVTSV